ncbi:MAG: phosphoribosyltransferase [Thermoproteota archaeon]|nr:MAG: phosphoribosyltransferase [Candidatus Korarchaeota archaeon]
MLLANRAAAGRKLAEELQPLVENWPDPIILALPRGGIEVGAEISRSLNIPMTVFIVRKIGAPGNPEYAIGAVAETGTVVVSDATLAEERYLQRTKDAELKRIERYKELYRNGEELPPLDGRTLIFVDDGVATGATLKAALKVFRQPDAPKVARLVVAVAVAPARSAREIAKLADEAVFLHTPALFFAVSQFYEDFDDQPDDVLRRLLGLEDS